MSDKARLSDLGRRRQGRRFLGIGSGQNAVGAVEKCPARGDGRGESEGSMDIVAGTFDAGVRCKSPVFASPGAAPLHSGNLWHRPYAEAMAQDTFSRRTTSEIARGKSVMFSAHFEDGRTGYFVVPGHGTSDEDYRAMDAALKRQRMGELPEGVIRTVKRVR